MTSGVRGDSNLQSSNWLSTTDDRWARVLGALQHDAYHLPKYVELDSTRPDHQPGAYVFESGYGTLFLPLIVRDIPGTELRDASSPYGYPGPLFCVSEGVDARLFLTHAIGEMRGFLAERGNVALFVRMHPLMPVPVEPFRESGAIVVHGPTISIDLSKTNEEMWSDLRQNHRRGINKARRAGVSFHHDAEWAGFETFVELYEATMRRQNAAEQYFFSREYFEKLRDTLGGTFQLLTVRHEHRVISAGAFSECNGIVQYHLSGSAEDYLPLQPLKLLLHEAGKWARERGNHVLHLGGGVGVAQDSLFSFKAGFSKRTAQFCTWRLITNPQAYRGLALERGLDEGPIDETGFFPIYRRPR